MPYWKKGLGNDIPLVERELLYKLAQDANPGTIVNIGVNRGTSLHCLAAGAPKAEIYGIDIQFRTPIFEKDKLPKNVYFVEANNTTFNAINEVPLVFVDGNHEYSMIMDDIINWTPRIIAGGAIAFHDYNPPEPFKWRLGGVKQAVDGWSNSTDGAEWKETAIAGSIIAFRRMS